MSPRLIARQVALAALALAAVWVGVTAFTGGITFSVAGHRFTSREPMRPLYWAALPLALFVWANGVERTARAWSRWMARLQNHHHVIALLLALGTFIVGVAYASTVANGSDSYGYISEADLWLRADLRQPQPWAAEAPWPAALRTFGPLGYTPAGTGTPTDIVPIYPPGYPLMMAFAKALGGQGAMFLVTPLCGALLVLTTWSIGRRLASSGTGLVAALFVATSPAFLFMLVVPMSDIPAAVGWAGAFYFLLRPGVAAGFGAGLAAGLAILIRPNLVWMAGPPAAWLLWRAIRPLRESRTIAFTRILGFTLGVMAAVGFLATLNARLYGSPFRTGYGDAGWLFSWSHVPANFRIYFGWLISSQTPLILAGIAALVWPARRLWPSLEDPLLFRVITCCLAALWLFYFVYFPFEDWWFLRFMLTSWPFIMLGLAAAIAAFAHTSHLRLIVCTWLVVVLGVHALNESRLRGVFGLWRGDREWVAAARATQDAIPSTSVVISKLHSGSVRYYGGRMTLEYSWLDPAWLDRTVAWLSDRGAAPHALLARLEVAEFKARFRGSATLARLDEPPVFQFPDTGLALYALSGTPPAATRAVTYEPAPLRSSLPAERSSFRFQSAASTAPKAVDWTRITLPFDATALTPEPVWAYNPYTRSMFAGRNRQGLYESKDRGATWIRVDDGSFVSSGVNSDAYALQVGPGGVMYSTDHNSGFYQSADGGRHWTKIYSALSVTSRVWIDPERPTNIYRSRWRATESEPVETCRELSRSTNGGASFQPVDIPKCVVESIAVAGSLVCYAMPGSIACSDNGGSWQDVPMTPILASVAIDRRLNSHPELTIDRATRELLILSGGALYETRAERTVVARKTAGAATHGRLIDLVLDSKRPFPSWAVSAFGEGKPSKLVRIVASGEATFYDGPKPSGFRLKAIDTDTNTVYVWTLEGFYRGVVK